MAPVALAVADLALDAEPTRDRRHTDGKTMTLAYTRREARARPCLFPGDCGFEWRRTRVACGGMPAAMPLLATASPTPKDIAKIMTTKRSPAAFWTIAALAFFGSVSAFAYAGVLVLFPNGLPSDRMIDATEIRATTKLRSPITFERTSGPGV